jgi:protein tyrosine/serine phosphatase
LGTKACDRGRKGGHVGDDHWRARRAQARRMAEGAPRFRDLGGIAAADDQTIRWGILYRSEALWRLTETDLDVLRALRLRTVCDLRGEPERLHSPHRWPDELAVDFLNLAVLGRKPDPLAIAAVLASHLDCLNAAFDTVTRDFGSVENYLASVGGLDADRRSRLRALLLE